MVYIFLNSIVLCIIVPREKKKEYLKNDFRINNGTSARKVRLCQTAEWKLTNSLAHLTTKETKLAGLVSLFFYSLLLSQSESD